MIPDDLRGVRDIMAAAQAAFPASPTLEDVRTSAVALYAQNLSLPDGVAFTEADEGGIPGTWGDSADTISGRVLLYCHGGGYAAGSTAAWRAISGELGRRFKMRSFSVDYRLAPEHPFPAAIDDCFAAYRSLIDRGVAARDIVIAGDSCGGALAISVMLKARQEGLPQPSSAFVMSPWVDLTLSQESQLLKAKVDPVASMAGLEMFRDLYLKDHDPRDPLASPMFADMTGLPPTLIHAGSSEVMLDEIIRLARQFAISDVLVKLEIWPLYHHEFQVWYGRLAAGRKALRQAEAFVADALADALCR